MKYILLTLFILVSLFLFSCKTIKPAYEVIPYFTKDLKLDETYNFYHQPNKRLQFSLPSDTSKKIDVLVYKLPVSEDDNTYLATFSNNKIIFWGYPHEFARSNNQLFNEIGRKAVEEYKKLEY